jgi:Ca2+-binding EF-hand superfamily protein
MGALGTKKAVKPELSQTQIEYLKARTRMSEEEIQKWFSKSNKIFFSKMSFFLDGFYKDCPDGLLTQKHFVQMYNQAFPEGDATQYAKRIFVTFDKDNSGSFFFSSY